MNRNASRQIRHRAYQSPLREEQADATRQRILAAALALVTRGERALTFVAVSREARVAIATVYRHFPARHDLLVGLSQKLEAEERPSSRVGMTMMEVRAEFRARCAALDTPGPGATRLDQTRDLFELSRMVSVPVRRAVFDRLFRERAPRLVPDERARIVDLAVVIGSSAMIDSCCGYLGCTGAEAGERLLLGLDALFVFAATTQPPE